MFVYARRHRVVPAWCVWFTMIRLKRVYEEAKRADGQRVLVERLWPRGVSKENAAVDVWLKEIAPSAVLRKWYSHESAKWERFRQKYRKELDGNEVAVAQIKQIVKSGTVTFVYAAKDEQHNSAVVLKAYLEGRAS